MSKCRKTLCTLTAVILIICIIPLTAGAFRSDRGGVVTVDDTLGVIGEADCEYIMKTGEEIASMYEIDITVVTADYYSSSYDGSMAFSDNYYYEKYGDRLVDGILLFIDMEGGEGNRNVYIHTSGRCSLFIDEYVIDYEFLDGIIDWLMYGSYSDAADFFFGKLKYYMDTYDSEFVTDANGEYAEPDYGDYYEYGYDDDYYIIGGDDDHRAYINGYRSRTVPKISTVVFCIILCLAAGGISVYAVNKRYRQFGVNAGTDVNAKTEADLKVSTDAVINRVVHTRRIPKNPPPSSRSGGHSVGHSGGFSGGHSGGGHAGGGKGF